MKATLYIDKGKPLVSVFPEKLSDGSVAWNLDLNGRTIPFCSEKFADEAFRAIRFALEQSNESVLVL